MEKKTSTAAEFRDPTRLVTGPITGKTVRIRPLDPRNFVELGMIPGMLREVGGEVDGDRVERVVKGDKTLALAMFNRILTDGIVEPRVVENLKDAEESDDTIAIEHLGADQGFFGNEILALSGLGRTPKGGPFRRWFSRVVGRRNR